MRYPDGTKRPSSSASQLGARTGATLAALPLWSELLGAGTRSLPFPQDLVYHRHNCGKRYDKQHRQKQDQISTDIALTCAIRTIPKLVRDETNPEQHRGMDNDATRVEPRGCEQHSEREYDE